MVTILIIGFLLSSCIIAFVAWLFGYEEGRKVSSSLENAAHKEHDKRVHELVNSNYQNMIDLGMAIEVENRKYCRVCKEVKV